MATNSTSLEKKTPIAYARPEFIFDYPMPEEIARKPMINFEAIPDECFREILPLYDSDETQQKLFAVFSLIAGEKKYYTYQEHARKAIERGLTQKEFNDLLLVLFKKNLIHTKTVEKGAKKQESINAFIFLKKAQLTQREKVTSSRAEKEDYKQTRIPEEFKDEKYLAPPVEGIYVRPHNLPSSDCREILREESLRKIYDGNNETVARERFLLFSIAALDADWDGEKIVEKVGIYGVAKSYGLIVHRAAKFHIPEENVKKHILAMLEAKILHTVKRNNICFFGTPFLKTATFKRDMVDPEKKTRTQTPEFIKDEKYRAPPKPEGFRRWGRPLIEKDVAAALHDESLCQIHPEPDSDQGRLYTTIFNIVAFGCEKNDDGEIVYPQTMIPSVVSFGYVVKQCNTFGISDEDTIASCVKTLLDRQVLHVRFDNVNHNGYYLVATPFLRNARRFHEPENWLELRAKYIPKPEDWVSTQTKEVPPLWLDMFLKPEPTVGEKHTHQWFRCRNSLMAFHHESLVQIHPDYESDEGRLRCLVFDIIAFPDVYVVDPSLNNDLSEDEDEFKDATTSCASCYGTLLRAARLLGVTREDFDANLLALCESNCVFCDIDSHNARSIDATPFLATVRTTKKNREIRPRKRKLNRAEKKEQEKEDEEQEDSPNQVQLSKKARVDKVAGLPHKKKDNDFCVGVEDQVCVYGTDGQPVKAEDDWMEHFPFNQSSSGEVVRSDTCFSCCRALRDMKRGIESFIMTRMVRSLILNRHVDASTSYLRIREALLKVPTYASGVCQICHGPFDETYKTSECSGNFPKHPWSRSFNIIDPENGNRFVSVDDIYRRGSIVHLLCNFAQHTSSMAKFIQDCAFLANKIDLQRFEQHRAGKSTYSDLFITCLPPEIESYLCVITNNTHKLRWETVREIIRNSLRTYEHYTGLRIGSGPQNDLDLDHYNNWPAALKLSIDRIDATINDGPDSPPQNYRVTFRMLNLAKSTFGDSVVFDFLAKIIKQYRK